MKGGVTEVRHFVGAQCVIDAPVFSGPLVAQVGKCGVENGLFLKTIGEPVVTGGA